MIGVPVDERAQLDAAFQSFGEVAERVQAAWRSLQECASRLDRDLASANARLQCQVDALENLSGSLAAVLRAIPCGVLVAGADGVIVMANPAAEDILGMKGRDLIGRPAAELKDTRGNPLLRLPEGPGRSGERVIHGAAGARIVDGCVVVAADTEGHPLGLVEVLNDRSEVKALQEEVRRLDALAELGRVAAIIAHEIRNPLSGIRGFAGMLERHFRGEHEDGPQHRWARRICEGVERADAIIDSVLYLARPRPALTRVLEVESLVCDALESAAAAAPKLLRGVRVKKAVRPSGLTVCGDQVRLLQAIGNLVQNALEAMQGDGVLEVSAERRRGEVVIEVRDSGPGLSDEVRRRLFEPFYTTKTEGAGLGLALVQRIAAAHGGSVAALPCALGACFALHLPAPDPHEEADAA